MKQGKSLIQLANTITTNQKNKTDYVVGTEKLRMDLVNDAAQLIIDDGAMFTPSHLTHQQIATGIGIPQRYYDKLRNDAPNLFLDNVNHWFHKEPNRRMIRTMETSARAWLSDRYRRIDHEMITEAVFPVIMNAGGDVQMRSMDVTDDRLYLKAIFPKVEGEVKVGDVVRGGIVITNSEVGLGALEIRPFIERLVCTNGMVVSDVNGNGAMRRHHVGRTVESWLEGDYSVLSTETMVLEDRALISKMRDSVVNAIEQTSFERLLKRMQETSDTMAVQRPVKAVEVLQKAGMFSVMEGESILERLIRNQDYTQWGMLNAITELANDTESYDRATELETLGGRILTLGKGEWNKIAEAA
jgi:hypothetical protein